MKDFPTTLKIMEDRYRGRCDELANQIYFQISITFQTLRCFEKTIQCFTGNISIGFFSMQLDKKDWEGI